MEELLEILNNVKADVDYEHEEHLVDDGILESFDIVQIVMQANEAFDIEIGAEDIVPENFNSAASLWKLIQKLQG